MYGFGQVFGCYVGTYDFKTHWNHTYLLPESQSAQVGPVSRSYTKYKTQSQTADSGAYRTTCAEAAPVEPDLDKILP